MEISPATFCPQGGSRCPKGSHRSQSQEGWGKGKGWDRTHSEADPRAVPAAWIDESQLGAGEFCLARSTSEKVPEKKLLLAFVKAVFAERGVHKLLLSFNWQN